jgi:hypothetical protein
VIKVMNDCLKRYQNRNSPERKQHRASNRFWSLLDDPSSLMLLLSRNPGRKAFYENLNWNEELSRCNKSKIDWEFLTHNLDMIKFPPDIDVKWMDTVPKLAKSRAPDSSFTTDPDTLAVLFGETGAANRSFPVVCLDTLNAFRDTAWMITFSIRPMLHCANWTMIIVKVSGIGSELGLMKPDMVSAFDEIK